MRWKMKNNAWICCSSVLCGGKGCVECWLDNWLRGTMTSLVFLILISSSRALTSCSNKKRSLGAFKIQSPTTDPDSSCSTQRNDRRNLLKLVFISLVSPPIILPPLSHALSEDTKRSSLLEQRLQLNLMSSPPYEMESSDVYYPPYVFLIPF